MAAVPAVGKSMEGDAAALSQSSPSLVELKRCLLLSYLQCSERGLMYSANWAIELANSLEVSEMFDVPQSQHSSDFLQEISVYWLAKSLFDLREYRRAAHALRQCTSQEAFFLKCYSLYLAGEKDKEDNIIDALGPDDATSMKNEELSSLKNELAVRAASKQLDGFGYYLYGVVLNEFNAQAEAQKMFLRSIHLTPLLWASWHELSKTCEDRTMLYSLELPNHWLRDFFFAEASLELQFTDDALSYYTNLSLAGFEGSPYVQNQLALIHYNQKNFIQAATMYWNLHKTDPYRLTGIDIYSNVLFVMERLPDLSRLAQDVVKVDKYRSETCSVLGNFYSLRGDHEMAIVYFRRAVKLNRHDHSAWILLGHEYVEMNNCSMAIEAYCRGVEANKHDFRGYYGLGQTYEILKMPHFALYYFKQAHRLRSSDSRILYALGCCHIELQQHEEAKKCLLRAIAFKDQEGTALIKLARLYAKLSEDEEAAKLYNRFVAQAETSDVGVHLPEEQGPAHLFLAQYYVKMGSFREAEAHAHKSTNFVKTKEEGKSLLQEIAKLKAVQESSGKQVAADLAMIDIDHEFSPIAATGTAS